MRETEKIARYMKAHGITYRDVAEKAGMTAQNVWYILNDEKGHGKSGTGGKRDPSFRSVEKICGAVGIELQVRATGKEPDPERLLEKAKSMDSVSFSAVQTLLETMGYKISLCAGNGKIF